MIPEVDAVPTEVEDNVLNAHTAIGLDTPVIDAISYMDDLLVLLIWFSMFEFCLRELIHTSGGHSYAQ